MLFEESYNEIPVFFLFFMLMFCVTINSIFYFMIIDIYLQAYVDFFPQTISSTRLSWCIQNKIQ